MKLSIFDMFDGYVDKDSALPASSAVSAERVKNLTLAMVNKKCAHPMTPADKPPKRKLKITLIAVAAMLVLAATALAITVFSTGEMPESIRRLVGIEEGMVAEYIEYDSIVFAPKAHYSDTHREARGELYVSRGQTIRGENLLTQDFTASAVTLEQCEDYVWRWLLEDGKTCAEVVPIDLSLERLRQESEQPVPRHWNFVGMRSVFILPAEDETPFTVRLCAGYESEDGRAFNVERVSAPFTIEPSRAYKAVKIDIAEPVEFTFGSEGKTGYITSIEITTDMLLVTATMEGITRLTESIYGEKSTLASDEWLELMRQYSDYENFAWNMEIKLKDGGTISREELLMMTYIGGRAPASYENDECVAFTDWREAFDPQQVANVTLGGRAFEIISD